MRPTVMVVVTRVLVVTVVMVMHSNTLLSLFCVPETIFGIYASSGVAGESA
jgi:hypothetical protein